MIGLILSGLAIALLLDDDNEGKGVRDDERIKKNGGSGDFGDSDGGQHKGGAKRRRATSIKSRVTEKQLREILKKEGESNGTKKKKGDKKATGSPQKSKKGSRSQKKETKKKVTK